MAYAWHWEGVRMYHNLGDMSNFRAGAKIACMLWELCIVLGLYSILPWLKSRQQDLYHSKSDDFTTH
jgi:hypothetical protein